LAASLPPRRGVWFARPRPVRRTLRKIPEWAFLPSGIWVAVNAYLRTSHQAAPIWFDALGYVGFALLAIMFLWWRIAELLARRTLRQDREFSDRPAGIKEYPIEIVILREGKELAADRGFAWFEEGLLNFNGGTTSFVLAAADIVPRKKFGQTDPYLNQPADCIRMVGLGHGAAVRLLPLNGFRRWGFRFVLWRFLSAKVEVEKARQWPPFHGYGEAPEEPIPLRSAVEVGQAAAKDGISQGVVRS
jgi:hypothetical protein